MPLFAATLVVLKAPPAGMAAHEPHVGVGMCLRYPKCVQSELQTPKNWKLNPFPNEDANPPVSFSCSPNVSPHNIWLWVRGSRAHVPWPSHPKAMTKVGTEPLEWVHFTTAQFLVVICHSHMIGISPVLVA